MTISKKQINKCFYGFEDDSAEFSKPDNTNPWDHENSGVGFNAKFDDDSGYESGEGAYAYDASCEAFLRPSTVGPDIDAPHTRLSGLIDGQNDQPAGKLLGGGGPVSDNKHGGVGPGRPRYAPKNLGPSSQKNAGSRGGRDDTGGRR